MANSELREFHNPGIIPPKYADLHIHSTVSDGLLSIEQIVDQAVAKNLDAIAITDHEVTFGGEKAANYAARCGYPLKVVTGEEVTTESGHLIGLFLENRIPSGKSLPWTIAEIHRQNGLVVVPHPRLFLTRSLTERSIQKIIQNPDPQIYFDGFEIYNAAVGRIQIRDFNQEAKSFFLSDGQFLGAPVGGTDAHFWTIGLGLTGYEGDLFQAIKNRQTSVYHTTGKERIGINDLARQSFASLILEPTRRIRRLTLGA